MTHDDLFKEADMNLILSAWIQDFNGWHRYFPYGIPATVIFECREDGIWDAHLWDMERWMISSQGRTLPGDNKDIDNVKHQVDLLLQGMGFILTDALPGHCRSLPGYL
jgi:hypothetical protein